MGQVRKQFDSNIDAYQSDYIPKLCKGKPAEEPTICLMIEGSVNKINFNFFIHLLNLKFDL
jgi:hypothetical protein